MKVTNNSSAPQGIHTLRGRVYLKPGQSRDDLPMSESQVERAKRIQALELTGKPSKGTSEPRRNADGDTPEMAEMRKQFDASYKGVVDRLRDAQQELADSKAASETALSAKDKEITDLKRQLAEQGDPPAGDEGSPDRDALKQKATELGLEFPKNIPTDKLAEMIEAKTKEQK